MLGKLTHMVGRMHLNTATNTVPNRFIHLATRRHMNRRVYWLLAGLVGVGVGAVTYTSLVADLALAATNGLLFGVGSGLTVRNHLLLKERYDAYGAGSNWWNAALAALVVVAGVFGVSPTLPIPADVGFALTVLVVGTIFVAWNLGVGGTLRIATDSTE